MAMCTQGNHSGLGSKVVYGGFTANFRGWRTIARKGFLDPISNEEGVRHARGYAD